jgi:hypothetical protein
MNQNHGICESTLRVVVIPSLQCPTLLAPY